MGRYVFDDETARWVDQAPGGELEMDAQDMKYALEREVQDWIEGLEVRAIDERAAATRWEAHAMKYWRWAFASTAVAGLAWCCFALALVTGCAHPHTEDTVDLGVFNWSLATDPETVRQIERAYGIEPEPMDETPIDWRALGWPHAQPLEPADEPGFYYQDDARSFIECPAICLHRRGEATDGR